MCACGILRGVVTKLLCHIAHMLLLGFSFNISSIEESIKGGDSLTSVEISYGGKLINEAQFTEIEVG